MQSERQRGRKPPQGTESYWTTEYQERYVAPFRSKVTRGKTTSGQTPGGKITPGQTSVGQTPSGKTTTGQTFGGKVYRGQTSGGKTSRGPPSGGKPTRSQPSGAQPSGGQAFESLPAKTMTQKQDGGETTVRSFIISHKWTEAPVLPAALVETVQDTTRYKKPPHMPLTDREKTDYTTLYMDDYKSWKVKRQQPILQKHNLHVREGLGFRDTEMAYMPEPERRDEEPGPMESITSYRADYVTHPIQRIPRMVKGSASKARIAVASEPPMATSKDATFSDREPGVCHEFKVWSVETNYNPKLKGPTSVGAGRLHTHVPVDFNTLLHPLPNCSAHLHPLPNCNAHLHPLPNCKELNEALQTAAAITQDCQIWDAVQCPNPGCDRKTTRTSATLRPKGNTTVMADPEDNPGEMCSGFHSSTEDGLTRKVCWSVEKEVP